MPDLQKDTISVFLGSFGTPDEAFGARSLLLWVFEELLFSPRGSSRFPVGGVALETTPIQTLNK